MRSNRQPENLLRILNITYPIIQAPMAGGATTAELVSAVSNSGALGSLGAGYLSPEKTESEIKAIRNLTNKPFAVNVFIPEHSEFDINKINRMNNRLNQYRELFNLPFNPIISPPNPNLFNEQLEIIIKHRVPIFSCTFGMPSKEVILRLKKHDIVIIATATTVEEGLALEQQGVDIVIAQGIEAGGHRGTFLKTPIDKQPSVMTLVPQLVDQLNIPVVAAGGIMDARGYQAALCLGAVGVQMGTAFLTTEESGISELYKQTLLESHTDKTVITKIFSGKPARGIKNRFVKEMEIHQDDIPDYPIQNSMTRDIRKAAQMNNNPEYLSLWAGSGVSQCQKTNAHDLISQILSQNTI